MEKEASQMIAAGYTDYEIAEELFGKRELFKRIKRFRARRP